MEFRVNAVMRVVKTHYGKFNGAITNVQNFMAYAKDERGRFLSGTVTVEQARATTQRVMEELAFLEEACRDYKDALQNTLDEVRHEYWRDCSFGVTEVVGPGTARMIIWADCGDAGNTVDTIMEYKIRPFQSPPERVVDTARDLLSDLWGLYHV